jgi:hypothetical protein
MDLGKLTYSLLSNDATLTGIVGSKIFPVQVPQDTSFPAITYQHDSVVPTNMKDGPSPLDVVGLVIIAYAQSYAVANSIMSRVRTLLDHYQGTVEGVTVDKISFAGQSDNDFVDETGFFIIEQSYQARMKR